MTQHSEMQVVPSHNSHPLAFGFNKVLMAG